MIIILKHILDKTTKQDASIFLAPFIKGGWLQKSGQIVSISILWQRSIRTREMQYHALVEIQPDPVAKRVIKKLNGKVMRGKRIVICEYHKRSWRNDQRLSRYNTKKKWRNDKRICDRRDQYEEIEPEQPNVTNKRPFQTQDW